MKIESVRLENFKRFTNLSINNIPENAKLVMLIGPNGCGKSSIFDAFKVWQLWNGFATLPHDQSYCNKKKAGEDGFNNSNELVNVEFHNYNGGDSKKNRYLFYFRTAYRNESSLSVKQISKVDSPTMTVNSKMMIENDQEVGGNYQRLVSKTLEKVYDNSYDDIKISSLRNELVGKIGESLVRLFGDLSLSGIGNPTERADFYFSKGLSHDYSYKNLSGGEKAAFDLLLDLVIKQEYYPDTVFCIDEPEAHMHTSLQSKLLHEVYNLIDDNNQLWIATHSLGMMKKARELEGSNPGSVVFLNFDGFDFDDIVQISPSPLGSEMWSKILDLTLDSYASYMAPETVVFCEGTTNGRIRKGFDARCYANIFSNKHPNVVFYPIGGCTDIEADKLKVIELSKALAPNTRVIRIIDKDDRSEEEIRELNSKGIKVLGRRHIESYILDDEILEKWCKESGKPECVEKVLSIKKQALEDSLARKNAVDDIKSASNDIVTKIKKLLAITGCGNSGEAIMRDTLTLLITPETNVFKEMESIIFPN